MTALEVAPEHLGPLYEATLTPDERRRRGAFYTPTALASRLAEATLAGLPPTATVCDPAVGGAALLLAAARVLIAQGADPRHVVQHQLFGVDNDPAAAEVARRALRELGGEPHIDVADALARDWPERFDAVITNPPFLNQLRSATVRRTRYGSAAARGYADTANLFLLLSLDLVRDGGRVGIILPEPILSVRDGAATRAAVGATTTLADLWRAEGVFGPGVRAIVAVLEKRPDDDENWRCGRWATRVALDIPPVSLVGDGTIGDRAAVTADFRDQFYGAAAVIDEDGPGARVATCGLIEPGRVDWGVRPARVAGRSFLRPRADLARATPAIQEWARRRMVPKVMVATQTRIVEAAPDEEGAWLPLVPVVSVVPHDPTDVWPLLAVLLAPPVSAWAHRETTGSALGRDAIKLSARQVAALPLPADGGPWRRATELARSGRVEEMGALMCDAYGVPRDPVLGWWSERLARIQKRADRI